MKKKFNFLKLKNKYKTRNNPEENNKEKLNLNIEQKEKKFQSNLKVNRIYRINPTNNIKIKLLNTKKNPMKKIKKN